MRKMTITRALSELKLLKKRHEKVLSECQPIAVKQGSKLRKPYTSMKPEDFEKQINPGMESIEKLEDLIFEIKSKIDQSNSVTKVKIGSKEMTVQEAITKKGLIEFKKRRLEAFKYELLRARTEFDAAIEENRRRVEKQIQDATSSNSGAKPDEDLIKTIESTNEALYKVEFLDHGLSDKIKELETEIDEFETNIDFALSESNSITTIEVSD